MKKFITLVAAAAVAMTASAQEKEWNISDFEAVTFTSETTIDGLTIYATEKGSVTIDANNKTVDGVKYTQRLKTGGAGSLTDGVLSRVVSFDVPSNGTISFIATSSNSNDARVVGVSFGEFLAFPAEGEYPAGLNTFDVEPGNPELSSLQYSGGEATKVYIYSQSGGVNFYDFKFTPSEDDPAAATFDWEPVSLYPQSISDIMVVDFMGNVNFNCYEEGVKITDVMPVWIDEDDNEIKAVSGEQNPFGIDPSAFTYTFDINEIKANGDYILCFPEGMLINGKGEKSAKIQIPYTLNDVELSPAMFDDFEVLSVTPELSQPQAIWSDQIVTVNTNHNDAIGVTTLEIKDITEGEESVLFSSNFSTARQLGDSSPISWEVANEYKFFQDHIYRAEFTFYNGVNEFDTETGAATPIVAKATFDFAGRVEGFKYSSETLLDITPAPYSTVISRPEQAVFTYKFSGPVNVYKAVTPLGMNGQVDYPESCLSSNEDKTVWTLNLSDNDYVKTVDAVLSINIYARDLEGFQLRGDWGEDYNSCFTAEWQCDLGAFPITVVSPVAGESIDRLSEIVVKAADGQPMSWSWMGEAVILNQLGEILGSLVYDDPEGVDSDSAMGEIRFTRWMDDEWNVTPIDIVEEGYYAVQFSSGCFLQGDQFESKQSKGLISTIVVTGNLDNEDPGDDTNVEETFFMVKADPADGSTVTSLSKIKVYFQDVVNCEEFNVNVVNVADGSVVTTGYCLYDWDILEGLQIDLAQPVTEAGEYEIIIPAGKVGDETFYESEGKRGICNPEIKLTYTVAPEGGDGVDAVSAAAAANVYDVNGRLVLRNASAADIKTLDKGLYIIGGKKVVK